MRFDIPINPASVSIASQGFEKDSQIQYHRSYNIDQAGPGVIALKDVEGFPVCLLKQRKTCQDRIFRQLRRISRKNLVPLIDVFHSKGSVFLVYEYQHLAVSLGCAIAKIQFSEPDIATICKEILEGLQFIHYELKITHGSINIASILLTWTGQLQIGEYKELFEIGVNLCLGNTGDSIVEQKDSKGKESDVESIGWLVIYLSDQATLLLDSGLEMADPSLSETGRVFVEKTKNSSTKELLKVCLDEFGLKIGTNDA